MDLKSLVHFFQILSGECRLEQLIKVYHFPKVYFLVHWLRTRSWLYED